MALIKDYFEKTKKHIDEFGELTIVLMQVGAFFEVYGLKDNYDNIHGSNIMDFSRICDLNIADKKVCCGSEQVIMAGFSSSNFIVALSLLGLSSVLVSSGVIYRIMIIILNFK